MPGCALGQPADVGPWRWLTAFALVAAAHVLVAEWLASLESASVPSAAVMVIEASLLEPGPAASMPAVGDGSGPAEVPAPESLAPDPPAPAAAESEASQQAEPAVEPEPPPAPEAPPRADPPSVVVPPPPSPPKVVPKRAAKATAKPTSTSAEPGRRAASPGTEPSATGGPAGGAPATGPRHDAAYLNNPAPRYPAAARRQNLQGKVLVYAVVAPAGHCARAEVRKSSGHPILDEAALQAVRGWRFVPATRDGQPVAAGVEIPIVFRLEG